MDDNITLQMITELYRCFDILNKDKFGDTLECPIITISYDKKAYGTCTTKRFWYKNDEELEKLSEEDFKEAGTYYQINISSNYINEGVERLQEVLLHEMCHLANCLKGVSDCNGKKHNKKFKTQAEAVGLDCGENDKKYGWGFTTATPALKEYFENTLKMNPEVFQYYFKLPEKKKEDKDPPKKFNKTIWCPNCQLEIKLEEGFDSYSDFWVDDLSCPSCGGQFELKPKGKRGRKAKED